MVTLTSDCNERPVRITALILVIVRAYPGYACRSLGAYMGTERPESTFPWVPIIRLCIWDVSGARATPAGD